MIMLADPAAQIFSMPAGESSTRKLERDACRERLDRSVLPPSTQPDRKIALENEGVHFTVTVVPGGFERFFSLTEQRGVTTTDHDGLGAAAREAGVDPIGPPLSDDEVAQIVAGKTRLDGDGAFLRHA